MDNERIVALVLVLYGFVDEDYFEHGLSTWIADAEGFVGEG
jgi:hypothetical protein